MLARVKSMLGITGSYQDATIQGYIDEVQRFLIDAGVKQSVIDSDIAVGIIARGVADLWNYGSGGTSLSPYFVQRATQLALPGNDEIAQINETLSTVVEGGSDE